MISKSRMRLVLILSILNIIITNSLYFIMFDFDLPNSIEVSTRDEILLQEQFSLIEKLALSYDYDKALSVLEQMDLTEEERTLKQDEITVLKNSLVKYEGEVPHIFSHSLIVYPSLAFDGDYKEEGYNLWMTTVYEFKMILQELYSRGYVLYDIRKLIQKDENGNIIKKDIYLPQGKTPFVLSVDDVCYYDYMKGDGFASKLVLDSNNEVATVVQDQLGVDQITKDGDVVPIVDEFVKQHPDFSFQGAKGILAVTGYEGILGYRITDVTGEELYTLLNEVRPVVEQLKETGWSFASHSYTHNNYFKDYTITMEQMTYDCERWNNQIKPVVGETNIYISPFGVKFNQEDQRYRYLIENFGFEIYCNVGGTVPSKYYADNMVMGRYAIDGLSLKKNKNLLSKFFDSDKVIDPERLPL